MRMTIVAVAALLLAGPALGRAQEKPPASKPAASTDVSVTVAYTGKAKVDDTHEIWVFLFTTPNPGPNSQPVAVQAVKKSGGTATFKNVTQDPVYVAAAYDEKGDYDGNTAAPPPGTPIGMYGKGSDMIAVKPGPTAKVKMSFDESRRMGQG